MNYRASSSGIPVLSYTTYVGDKELIMGNIRPMIRDFPINENDGIICVVEVDENNDPVETSAVPFNYSNNKKQGLFGRLGQQLYTDRMHILTRVLDYIYTGEGRGALLGLTTMFWNRRVIFVIVRGVSRTLKEIVGVTFMPQTKFSRI